MLRFPQWWAAHMKKTKHHYDDPSCDRCLFVVECTVRTHSRVAIHTERCQARQGLVDDTRPWRRFAFAWVRTCFVAATLTSVIVMQNIEHCVATCANAALTSRHTRVYQRCSMTIIIWPRFSLVQTEAHRLLWPYMFAEHFFFLHIDLNASKICVFQSRFWHFALSPLPASRISFAQRSGCNHDVFQCG